MTKRSFHQSIPCVLLIFVFLFSLCGTVAANIEIKTMTLRPTRYVIDADALNPHRDFNYIKGTVTVRYEGERPSQNTRVRLRIVDPATGMPVALVAGTDLATPSTFNPGALAAGQSVEQTFAFGLIPAERLNASTSYTLQANIESFVQISPPDGMWIWRFSSWVSGPSRHFYHFTNLVSGDPEYNVVAGVETLSIDRDWRIRTVGGSDAFPVSFFIRMIRYDDWEANPTWDVIDFELSVRMFDDTDTEVPLEPLPENETQFSEGFFSHLINPDPGWMMTRARTLSIRPTAQLRVTDRTYRVAIELRARPRIKARFEALAQDATTSQTLLDYNGQLRFGTGNRAFYVQMTEAARTTAPLLIYSTYANTPLAVSAVQHPASTHPYSGTLGNITVRLNNSGMASYHGTATFPLHNTTGRFHTVDFRAIRLRVGPTLTLSSTGASAPILMNPLPAGFGRTLDATPPVNRLANIANDLPTKEGIFLNSGLAPAEPVTWSFPSGIWVFEESKPIAIKVTAITLETGFTIDSRLRLTPTGETFDPVAAWHNRLEAAPDGLPDRIKHANDSYYRLIDSVDTTQPAYIDNDPQGGPNGNARLTASFWMRSGYVRPHFPHAELQVNSSYGVLRIKDDMIDVANSFLPNVNIYADYNAGSPPDTSGCDADGPFSAYFALRGTDNGRVRFTPVGGLWAECAPIGPNPITLAWGRLGAGVHAFSAAGFELVNFFMPGTFYPNGGLGAESFEGGHQYAPVAASIMGYVPGKWKRSDVEWPTLPAFRENTLRGDYAGVNLRVEDQPDPVIGHSFIGGVNAGAYPLKTPNTRYYARRSGVTGIHDAIGGPESVVLYGFNALFESYGFAFLDNVIVESVTDGGLFVPYPSAFSLPLKNFAFSSAGRPLRADLRETLETVKLAYWNCDLRPVSVSFERNPDNPCDPGSGFIKLHAEISLPNLGEKLYGDLGFWPDGNLSTPANSSVRSRLVGPNQLTFRGPMRAGNDGTETYTFTPATEIYLNNYANHAEAAPLGFINVAGWLDVAFFESLKIHLQTTVGSDPSGDNALLHITRGWTANESDFFSDPRGFDPTNRGFPTGMNLADYRNGPNNRPLARNEWMSGITFQYPLHWDASTRSFRSPDDFEGTVDLLILEAPHQLEYLSAEQAALSFGATFSGIPSLNLANMLVNQVDEATGALSALQEALGQAVVGALFLGASSFSGLLNDSLDALLGEILGEAFEAMALAQVLDPLGNPLDSGRLRPEAEWDALLNNSLTNPNAWLLTALRDLAGGVPTPPFVVTAQAKLEAILDAIDVFVDDQDGILATDSEGRYTLGARIVYALIDELMSSDVKAALGIKPGGKAETQLNAQTTKYIRKYAPSLDALKANLLRLREQVTDVRDGIALNGAVAGFIHGKFISTEGREELNALADLIKSDTVGHLKSRYAGRAHEFGDPANRAGSAAFLSLRVRDRLATTFIAGSIQVVLRQQLQEIQGFVDQATGSVFATLNRVIKEVTTEALGVINETITPMTGDFGGVAGTGGVTGYARILGNRLDHLRLDATLELTLDEPFTFAGFIEINQAAAAYGEGRDIRIGAFDVPIGLFDSTAYYTIIGRISLADSGLPLGIGGSIELTRGEITFESFRIKDLGAALMFGVAENYLAAKVGLEFQSFRVAGGVFIGRSQSIDPLLMVDPDVADMITPPFTGAYVYGEVFMPIVDFGCIFNVSAGLGIGVFYFIEGPTYGGKIYAAVKGEALCVVTVKGEIVLVGVKSDIFRFKGKGSISGSVGYCPFCVRFKKSITFTYDQRSGFDADY